ncbi:pseudouridylate synthase [Pedobacter petrophilus]|uniref:Pseudouridylate synthase n=1 Tax=Pedobacter petrophilus TaxID=1908241 RepID=A0A7K0FT46_9SPHI|nr:pseudouridylate synthase [Pedobacter petrophilus]MRX74541.1 pseudouridylate synthase [Pedobacter petrophilus]
MAEISIDPYFTPFDEVISTEIVSAKFSLMITKPHPLCLLAAKQLQAYLSNQTDWIHNFGLSDQNEGTVIGKMFGVLVVQNPLGEIGYLSAFSGKLAGSNQHAKFVPPVFDLLTENSFLNIGMEELTVMNQMISALEDQNHPAQKNEIIRLKEKRKAHSVALQDQIFEHYHFFNLAGEEKSLTEIFANAGYKKPPAGAGECAAPKLLQYAFQHKMRPIALAEFWWGQSPKSNFWKHGHFYACCKEKCEPIFGHTLTGIEIEKH